MINIFQKIKQKIKSSIIDEQSSHTIANELDFNEYHSTPVIKKEEKTYHFDEYVGGSQAFLTYQIAYDKTYTETAKVISKLPDADDKEKNMKRLFEISQSAFFLVGTTFNYAIIHGQLTAEYIRNIITNKLGEYSIDFKNFDYKNLIDVKIELFGFMDNSVLTRITFLNLDDSLAYSLLLQENISSFKEFIELSDNIAKNKIEEHANQKVDIAPTVVEKMKSNFTEEDWQRFTNGNSTFNNETASTIYREQSEMSLKNVRFKYISTYNLLIQSFKYGAIIDVSDFDGLMKHLTIKTVSKFYSASAYKSNKIENYTDKYTQKLNSKIRTDIKTVEELILFLKSNKMLIKLKQKENKND